MSSGASQLWTVNGESHQASSQNMAKQMLSVFMLHSKSVEFHQLKNAGYAPAVIADTVYISMHIF